MPPAATPTASCSASSGSSRCNSARRCDVPGVSPGRRPATIAGTTRAPAMTRGGLFRFGLGALDARQRCAGLVLTWPTTQRPRQLCGAFAPAPRARSLSLSLRRPSSRSGSRSVSPGLVGVARRAARRCDVPGVSPGRRPATPPEQSEPPRGIAGACHDLRFGLGALDARQRCAGLVLAWPTTQRPRQLCGAFAPAPRARSRSTSTWLLFLPSP